MVNSVYHFSKGKYFTFSNVNMTKRDKLLFLKYKEVLNQILPYLILQYYVVLILFQRMLSKIIKSINNFIIFHKHHVPVYVILCRYVTMMLWYSYPL